MSKNTKPDIKIEEYTEFEKFLVVQWLEKNPITRVDVRYKLPDGQTDRRMRG